MPDEVRTHIADGVESVAVYSACMAYRYWLGRVWDHTKPLLNFLLLNPSTASELADDPTVRRCRTRAANLGYGGVVITNLYAIRSTDPGILLVHQSPTSEAARPKRNEAAIVKANIVCDRTVAGWGTHGMDAALPPLERLYCLGVTKGGFPRHPLYLSYATEIVEYGTNQGNAHPLSRQGQPGTPHIHTGTRYSQDHPDPGCDRKTA